MRRAQHSLWTLAVAFACLGLIAGAATAAPRQVATLSGGAAGVEFRPVVEYEKLVLTVSGPGGMSFRREFAQGQAATFSAFGKGGQALPDGNYTYELLAVPRFSPEVRQRLAAARSQGNERAVLAELRQAGQLPKGTVQSGGFLMESGTFVVAGLAEETGPKAAKEAVRAVTAADQVIPDDLIVQQSLCVGFDCVNNENFGFDTIRLKENNLRIKFEDTSVGSFPTNDWQLTANDSASGGQSKFSIEDITGARVPFTVEAGATTNSVYVDSTGRVGFRTSTPVLDLHVNTSNTPAIRLEQNSSGGFTAQTWDIAGNEANFFVRDVTGGSRLSFRIRPGAPTSSIDIAADGDVGIGTASPGAKLHVVSGETRLDSADASLDTHFNFFGNGQNYLRGTTIIGDRAGDNVGIGCDSPGFDLVVGGTPSNCATAPFSHINAGDANWVGSSSRTVKQNIVPIEVPDILDKIEAVDVFAYDFINGSKNRMGLMAEDFHQVFGRGSDKMLDGGEVQMALWLAVQQLTAQNQGLTERLAALETQLAAEKSAQPEKN